jgi:hypothetical protein
MSLSRAASPSAECLRSCFLLYPAPPGHRFLVRTPRKRLDVCSKFGGFEREKAKLLGMPAPAQAPLSETSGTPTTTYTHPCRECGAPISNAVNVRVCPTCRRGSWNPETRRYESDDTRLTRAGGAPFEQGQYLRPDVERVDNSQNDVPASSTRRRPAVTTQTPTPTTTHRRAIIAVLAGVLVLAVLGSACGSAGTTTTTASGIPGSKGAWSQAGHPAAEADLESQSLGCLALGGGCGTHPSAASSAQGWAALLEGET